MPKRWRVALIVEMSGIYGRRVLRGIAQYLRTSQPWAIFLERRDLRSQSPPWLVDGDWDGVICRSGERELLETFAARGVPVVDINDRADRGLPRIWSDNRAIGRLGAEHLLERSFRHFAFCTLSDEAWAMARRDGFRASVEAAGFACETYDAPWLGRHVPEWDADQERIGAWLAGLPKPVGLMASNDQRGQHALEACRRVGLALPEEVAVVGVDNEEVFCELCDPPLSSVEPDPERVGREAAQLLARMMAGETVPATERLVPPIGVVLRQSTDVLGLDDRDVVAALAYIRRHACHGISVEDVVEHTAISRSTLERRFRNHIGHSPHAEIREVQLKRVKQLLTETELSLEAIAPLVGFDHPEYMSVVFRREVGQTPGQYRERS